MNEQTLRTAIIDIGSNSIRLVVYQGPERLPAILFNEKVMAGLGRGLADRGAIEQSGMEVAKAALKRFAAVTREMGVASLRTVATAAVRDASNGRELIEAAHAIGLSIELLSGEQEARGAGNGVLSAIPDADGIVGDLGGGSLELVRVRNGQVEDCASFPLGTLRIAGMRAKSGKQFEQSVKRVIQNAGWEGRGDKLPFYLVGGSWRALARVDMELSAYSLPIIHQYGMSLERIAKLGRTIAHLGKPRLRAIPGLSSARAAALGDATALLNLVLALMGSSGAVVSAFGLREGLLFDSLDDSIRTLDPLIVATREEGRILGRFTEHGDLVDQWIGSLFPDDPDACLRVRHAACLLADVGWHANPEFRAERGMEIALHGNWVAIDSAERAMLAQTVFTSLGGGAVRPPPLEQLASPDQLNSAIGWGLAIRLGQRLSAGQAGPLQRSHLNRNGNAVTLKLKGADRELYGEAVEKRHSALAAYLDCEALVCVD